MSIKLLQSIFLIVGTAIGAGILALPITTVASGFWGSALALFVAWVFMTVAAGFMLNARLLFADDIDISTMSTELLGMPAKVVIELCYLALLYALICLYVTVGSNWMADIIADASGFQMTTIQSQALFVGVLALLIFSGVGRLTLVNKIVTVTMMLLLVMIMMLSFPKVNVGHLQAYQLSTLPGIMPMLLTTFGFSIVIPSMATYLKNDRRKLSQALIAGSSIILITYICWNLTAFGVVGVHEEGLLQYTRSADKGTEVIKALGSIVEIPAFTQVGFGFMVTALVSSSFGVGLCLFAYLKDTLPIDNQNTKPVVAILLGFVPPVILLQLFPAGASSILSFAGIFVAAILGIMPSAMVLSQSYQSRATTSSAKEKVLAYACVLFFSSVILIEVTNLVL